MFASLPRKAGKILAVGCVVWNGLTSPMGLSFDIPGNGRVAYFGDIKLRVRDDGKGVLAEGIRSAAVTTPGLSVSGAVALRGVADAVQESHEDPKNGLVVYDRPDEAMREYVKRYGPLSRAAFFVSLADITPFQPPVRVHQKGDLLWSEAELRGMKLTWLGLVRGDERKVGIRLQRYVRKPTLESCKGATLDIDGQAVRFSTSYFQEPAARNLRETVQGEIDVAVLKKVAAAKQSTLDLCGLNRTLSAAAGEAAAKLAAAYEGAAAATAGGSATVSPPEALVGPRVPEGRAEGGQAQQAVHSD